ncbi:MAG: DNA-binding protein [Nitrospiraceae bacterium]|nr:MAG: DNA-binding protein [Nitrospiraceae bacterium]
MEFLTVKEVAKLLNISESYVYKNYGMFGGVRFGRTVRFEKTVLEEILNGYLEASREMACRNLEARQEGAVQDISDETGGSENRRRGKGRSGGDEYGLYQALLQPPQGTGKKKDP